MIRFRLQFFRGSVLKLTYSLFIDPLIVPDFSAHRSIGAIISANFIIIGATIGAIGATIGVIH